MDKDGKFIKNLQDRLQDAEVKAPDGLFEAVSKEMEARGLMPVSQPKRKPVWAWFLIPAAAAAVLVAVVLFRPATSAPDESRASSVPMISTLPLQANVDEPRILADAQIPQPAAPLPAAPLPPAAQPPAAQPADPVPSESQPSEVSLVEPVDTDPVLTAVGKPIPEDPDTLVREVYRGPDENLELEMESLDDQEDMKSKKRHGVRFDTDFQISGVVLSTDGNGRAEDRGSVNPIYPPFYDRPEGNLPVPDGSDAGYQPGMIALYSARPSVGYAAMKEGIDYSFSDIVHRLPVKVSATAGFQIKDWFRITTGITYSYLRSDFKMNALDPSVTGKRAYNGRQQLHYMGLPLNFQFRLFNVRFFSAYVSAGASMEGLVSGRRVFDDEKHSSERLKDPSLFFSLNGAFGLNFHLYGPLNLYFEPGVSWYFRNRSVLDNAYNAHQFNVSMNFGLRFDLK